MRTNKLQRKWTVIISLLVIHALGFYSGIGGPLIHLLLVAVVVVALAQVRARKRPVTKVVPHKKPTQPYRSRPISVNGNSTETVEASHAGGSRIHVNK